MTLVDVSESFTGQDGDSQPIFIVTVSCQIGQIFFSIFLGQLSADIDNAAF